MLITKEVMVKWNGNNRAYYESLGYVFSKNNAEFMIPIEHLSCGSSKRVELECDYCKEKFLRVFKDYRKLKKNMFGEVDCCLKCSRIKIRSVNMEKYGESSALKTDKIKKKLINTNNQRYGGNSPTSSKEIRKKIKNTFSGKYGVDNFSKTEEFKNIYKSRMIEKYNVEHYSKTEDFKKKFKNTSLNRYGVTHPMKNKQVLKKMESTNLEKYGKKYVMQVKKIKKKAMDAMYKKDVVPCSKQQRHIHSLVGGELNFVVENSFLDIAFIDEKFYLEYDGGGHNLQVKLGAMTQGQFDKKEKRRFFFLLDKGWKNICIKSLYDFLPSDKKIIEMVDFAKSKLENGNKSVIFCIDESYVKYGKRKFYYDFGELSRIEVKR